MPRGAESSMSRDRRGIQMIWSGRRTGNVARWTGKCRKGCSRMSLDRMKNKGGRALQGVPENGVSFFCKVSAEILEDVGKTGKLKKITSVTKVRHVSFDKVKTGYSA